MNITSLNSESFQDDEFFRYKRPEIIINYEGHNQHTKTLIININEISISLNRIPIEIIKFFSYELGTSIKNYSIKGRFSKEQLNTLLEKYINKYIICKKCLLPSTYYKFKKNSIKLICTACGNKSKLDFNKLTIFLLKEHKNIDFNKNIQNYN